MNYSDEQLREISALIDRYIFGRRVEWRQCEQSECGYWTEDQEYYNWRKTQPNWDFVDGCWTLQPCYFDRIVKGIDGDIEKWEPCAEYPSDHNAVAKMREKLRVLGKHIEFGIAIAHEVAAVFESQSGSREDEQFVFADDMCDILDATPLVQCLATLAAVGVDVEKELAEVKA